MLISEQSARGMWNVQRKREIQKQILTGKRHKKRSFGRPSHRWEDGIIQYVMAEDRFQRRDFVVAQTSFQALYNCDIYITFTCRMLWK